MPRTTIPTLIAVILLALPLLLAPRLSGAAEDLPTGDVFKPDRPVEITADYLTYDRETETYYAEGDVVIVQDSTVMRTDKAVMSVSAGVATAAGSVRMVDEAGNTVTGEDLTLNIEDKTAVLARGRIFYNEDNVYIWGAPLRKIGDRTYDARNAGFTTCDCEEGEEPAWSFTGSSAHIPIGEFMTARNVFFRIKGVPVLYSPYIRLPVKRKRQTGFLRPGAGYSKLRGFVLDNFFFWAVSPHQDMTFQLDIETTRGIGEGVEYRYYRTRKSFGEWRFSHFKERDMGRVREFREDIANLARPESASSTRWRARVNHTEVLGPGMNLKVDVDVVSDDEYFIDFGEGGERTLESLESNISFSRSWASSSLVVQARMFDNLLLEDDGAVLQKYPEATFTGNERRVPGTPLYFSHKSSYIYFHRDEGSTGHRLDLNPRLSLPMNPGGWFEFKPSIGPRGTFYVTKASSGADHEYDDRFLYDIRADLTSTFVRFFHPDLESLKAVRHTMRPRLSYTFIPQSVQSDLPNFDAVDRVEATNSVTYSLNSLLTGKFLGHDGGNRYLDFAYLELSQSFDINEATRDLTSATDKLRPFSDIRGEARVRPVEWARMATKGLYDVYDGRFNSYDASLDVHDDRGDSLHASYRFVRNGETYFESHARVKLTPSVDVLFAKRFSFEEDKALETSYGVEYTHQCWKMVASYTEKLEENIFLVTFDLLGLGRVAGVKGEMAAF